MLFLQISTFIGLMLCHFCVMLWSVRICGAVIRKIPYAVSAAFLFSAVFAVCITSDSQRLILCDYTFPLLQMIVLRFSLKKIGFGIIAEECVCFFLINIIVSFAARAGLSNDSISSCVVDLAVTALSAAICVVLCSRLFKRRIRYISRMTPRYLRVLMLVTMGCCAFLSVSVIELSSRNNDDMMKAFKYTFIVLIILLTFMVIFLMLSVSSSRYSKRINDSYRSQIKAQSEYYIKLSESITAMRRFRHDYNNLCIGLEHLIEQGRTDEALAKMREQHSRLNKQLVPFNTGNSIADALLSDKSLRAERSGIRLVFEGSVPPKGIDPTDLCIILGNPLDNAIEACEQLDNTENRIISISAACGSGCLFIDMTNPVERPVDVSGDTIPTTKPDKENHGWGLFSLRYTADLYHGSVTYECSDLKFHISISLCLDTSSAAAEKG